MTRRVKWKRTRRIAAHRRIVEGIEAEIVIETGITISHWGKHSFQKVCTVIFIYFSCLIFFYIETKGVDRGIDTEIATDRVGREDPLQDRQVKIRWRITEKICLKLRSNEKTRRNRKMPYPWCQLKLNRKQHKSHI